MKTNFNESEKKIIQVLESNAKDLGFDIEEEEKKEEENYKENPE